MVSEDEEVFSGVISMSVLVEDWNLPDMCLVCPFFSGQGCKVTMRLFPDWVNVATRPTGCPLSEYYEPPTYMVDNPNKIGEAEIDPQEAKDLSSVTPTKVVAQINFDNAELKEIVDEAVKRLKEKMKNERS